MAYPGTKKWREKMKARRENGNMPPQPRNGESAPVIQPVAAETDIFARLREKNLGHQAQQVVKEAEEKQKNLQTQLDNLVTKIAEYQQVREKGLNLQTEIEKNIEILKSARSTREALRVNGDDCAEISGEIDQAQEIVNEDKNTAFELNSQVKNLWLEIVRTLQSLRKEGWKLENAPAKIQGFVSQASAKAQEAIEELKSYIGYSSLLRQYFNEAVELLDQFQWKWALDKAENGLQLAEEIQACKSKLGKLFWRLENVACSEEASKLASEAEKALKKENKKDIENAKNLLYRAFKLQHTAFLEKKSCENVEQGKSSTLGEIVAGKKKEEKSGNNRQKPQKKPYPNPYLEEHRKK